MNIGNVLYVVLLDGNGIEFLKGKYLILYNVVIYIKKLLEYNMEIGFLLVDNLYIGVFCYY